jgi:hypothetical protein
MWIPLLFMFLIGAGAVFGVYAAIAYLPGMAAARRLDRRLHDVSMPAGADLDDSTIVKQSAEGPLPSLDRAMAKMRVGSWLGKPIEQAGSRRRRARSA